MQEFEAHWTAVNALGTQLQIQGSFKLVDFTTLKGELDTAITNVVGLDNTRSTGAGDRDIKRAALRERVRQFRAGVFSILPGTSYIRSLPKLPAANAISGVVLNALDDQKNLWTTINANSPAVPSFTPPLLLASAYPLLTFTADLTAMRASYAAVQAAAQNEQQGRAARDEVYGRARTRMLEYRRQVVAFLPPGNPLLLTIPAITPAPGSTPPAANLGFVWNAGTDMADGTWTYPDLTKIDHFELRAHPGPRYKAAEETAVPGFGNIDKNDTTLSTDYTLTAPGSVVFFKLYAVTATGNEKGSNAVRVVRP